MSEPVVTSNLDEALASLKAIDDANQASFDASLSTHFGPPPPVEPVPESTASSLPKHAYGAYRQRLRTTLPADCLGAPVEAEPRTDKSA